MASESVELRYEEAKNPKSMTDLSTELFRVCCDVLWAVGGCCGFLWLLLFCGSFFFQFDLIHLLRNLSKKS